MVALGPCLATYKLGLLMIIAFINQLLDMTVLDITCILCAVCRLVVSENLKVQRLSSFHNVQRHRAQVAQAGCTARLAAAKYGLPCSPLPQSARLLPAETFGTPGTPQITMERSTSLNGKSHYFNGHFQQLC